MAEYSKKTKYEILYEELFDAASKNPFFDPDTAYLFIEEAVQLRMSLDTIRNNIACPSTEISDTYTLERLANNLSINYQGVLHKLGLSPQAKATSLKHIPASLADNLHQQGETTSTEKEIFGG